MHYNATRHAKLLRRAATAVEQCDWITMARALSLAFAMLPPNVVTYCHFLYNQRKVNK